LVDHRRPTLLRMMHKGDPFKNELSLFVTDIGCS